MIARRCVNVKMCALNCYYHNAFLLFVWTLVATNNVYSWWYLTWPVWIKTLFSWFLCHWSMLYLRLTLGITQDRWYNSGIQSNIKITRNLVVQTQKWFTRCCTWTGILAQLTLKQIIPALRNITLGWIELLVVEETLDTSWLLQKKLPLLRLTCEGGVVFSCTSKVQGVHQAYNMVTR